MFVMDFRVLFVSAGASSFLLACAASTPSSSFDAGNGGSGSTGSTTSTTASSQTSATSATSGSSTAGSSATGTSGSTSTGTSTSGGPDGGSSGCSGLPLCDDFEGDTAGSAPAAALWSSFTGSYAADSITVDSTQHHSGTKSVKIVSGGMDAWGPLLTNTSAFSTLTGAVYGRFWVYLNAALPSSHHAFMTLQLSAAAAAPGAQIKGIEGTCQSPNPPGLLTWNLNDSLLPDVYNFTSRTIPAQTWTCFEFHTDAASGQIDAWLNGAHLDTMSLPNDAGAKWTGSAPTTPLRIYGLGLGWMAFNGVPMTLWFDDVALSSTGPIGCN
jgi:hypothetical protein